MMNRQVHPKIETMKSTCGKALALVALSLLLAHTGNAFANPAGGTVTSGSASISSAGSTVTINQTTGRATIDWSSFDIAKGETTTFVQPGSNSMTLNRIGSADPSQIFGTLSSNGKIYLVNLNGFIFGKGSTVNVGGILATTADIANADFMAGRMNFNKAGNANAAIINDGTISARDAGLVGFVAPTVANSGIITARLGRVNLASGDTMTMDMYGDNLVSVAVSNENAAHIVANSGLIHADGGQIALTAAAGRNIANGVISNSGMLQANSIGKKNGKIVLYAEGANAVAGNVTTDKGRKAGQSGIYMTGVADASGTGTGETGGTVALLADNVALDGDAVVAASGTSGGGDIRIGGDYLGGGDTPAAWNTYVGDGVSIYNDALKNGNGGRTIVWSDNDTFYYGSIYGRGGTQSGDGGFTETSGHGYLDAQGYVDLTAVNGNKGLYFLDPTNISIYGNVDPSYVSTDGSISLASSLKLWLDASDTSKVQLTYNSTGATATGSIGGTTLTVSSAAGLVVGARIRLTAAGAVATVDTVGADTYTITNISGTTVTVAAPLTATYTAQGLYQGYVSQLLDKSGRGNTMTATTPGQMPVWISNGQNGLGVASFDGVDDQMTANGADFAFTGLQNFSVIGSATSMGGDGITSPFIGNRDQSGGQFSWMIRALTANVHLHGSAQYLTGQTFTVGQSNILSTVTSGTTSLSSNLYIGGNLVQTTNNWTYYGTPASKIYLGNMYDGVSKYKYQDMTIYNAALSNDARALMEQYQAAKWNIALNAPGTGATEGAKATSATGYSVFSTRYLEKLSQTADVSLQASNNITLDLKGDTLNFATAGRSLTLNAGAAITANSTGTIATNGGNISMTSGTAMDVSKVALNAGGAGTVTLNAGGALTAGSISGRTVSAKSGSGTDLTIATGSTISGSATGTAVQLVSGRNFINNAGASALSAPSGRWLVYSTNPASDTLGGLTSTFRRYSCTTVSCPSFPAAGNGLMYSYTPVLTATPQSVGITYGDAKPNMTGYAYNLSGYLTGDATADSVTGSLTGTTPYAQYSPVNTYGINYASGSLASAMGYGFSYANNASAISVGAKALNVTANDQTKQYGDTRSFAGTEFSTSGLVGSDSVSLVTLASTGAAGTATVAGGPYAITASNATGSGLSNYTISYVNGQLAVTPKSLTVTASGQTKQYGDTFTFGGTEYSTSGLVNGDAVTSATLASAGAAATATVSGAPYSITASNAFGTGLSNYTISYVNGQLAVTPKALTVTATGQTKQYGDTFTFGGTEYSTSGLVNGDTVTSATLASAGAVNTATVSGAPYSITASNAVGTGLGNYTISYVNGQLAVTPKALTVTASGQTKQYGDTFTFGGTEFSTSGLVNGDTVTSATLASAGSAATATVSGAPYAVTASNAAGTGLSNYTISYVNGQLAVTPKALTVTATGGSKRYGDTLTYTGSEFTTSGLVNGDTVTSATIASAGAAGTAVVAGGPYAVTASNASGSGLSNYSIHYVNGQLSVTPRDLKIFVNNLTKDFGTPTVFAGTEFHTHGLRNGDTVTGVTLSSAGAPFNAAVGTFSIDASNATGSGLGNYVIHYVSGQLTVSPSAASDSLNDVENMVHINSGEPSPGADYLLVEFTQPLAEILGMTENERTIYSNQSDY